MYEFLAFGGVVYPYQLGVSRISELLGKIEIKKRLKLPFFVSFGSGCWAFFFLVPDLGDVGYIVGCFVTVYSSRGKAAFTLSQQKSRANLTVVVHHGESLG